MDCSSQSWSTQRTMKCPPLLSASCLTLIHSALIWILHSPNVSISIPKMNLIHCNCCREGKWVPWREGKGKIWCDGVFLIKTEAFRDTHGVPKGPELGDKFTHPYPLSFEGNDKRLSGCCALSSSLPRLSHMLSDADRGLLSRRSFPRTPRRPVRVPSTGSSLLIDTSPLFLPAPIRGCLPPPHTAQ